MKSGYVYVIVTFINYAAYIAVILLTLSYIIYVPSLYNPILKASDVTAAYGFLFDMVQPLLACFLSLNSWSHNSICSVL